MEINDELIDELWTLASRTPAKPKKTRGHRIKTKWMRLLKRREKEYLREASNAGQLTIIPQGPNQYLLSSRTRPGCFHAVDMTLKQCSCEWSSDFNHQGDCWHIKALHSLRVRDIITPEKIEEAASRMPKVVVSMMTALRQSAA